MICCGEPPDFSECLGKRQCHISIATAKHVSKGHDDNNYLTVGKYLKVYPSYVNTTDLLLVIVHGPLNIRSGQDAHDG